MMPISKASPNVSGTNSQWYIAVRANCARDQSMSDVLICSNIAVILLNVELNKCRD